MRNFYLGLLCVALLFFVTSCASQKTVSDIEKFDSPEHKKIYEYLLKTKKNFNERKAFDPSRLTENAKIMTEYQDEKIVATPKKLQEIWPQKINTYKKHEFKIRSIKVEKISIQGNMAQLKTKRTYYSSRWNEFYHYRISKKLKKIDGEWKLHRS